MDEKSRQDENGVPQDSLPHEAWVRLTTVLGSRLAVLLAVIGLVFIVLLIAGFIWYLVPVFGSNKGLTITQRKDLVQGFASVVQALAVVLTGTVGLIGLLFTWRSLRQTRESTQRTLELTEQGQITERFTRAIDQLGATYDNGSPRLEIRLGGIYGLERIDKESPGRAYHSTVMEILTAYVRRNAPFPTSPPEEASVAASASNKPNQAVDEAPEQDNTLGGGQYSDEEDPELAEMAENLARLALEMNRAPYVQPLRTDIQAILDVLRRREEDRVPVERRVSLDLRATDLHEVNLEEVNLREASLFEANLYRARLTNANFQQANLVGANLQKARLVKADLSRANLAYADFKEANLEEASLQKAHLFSANLQGAKLRGADLRGANFQQADLNLANLRSANLHEATLILAALYKADLSEANLQGADLQSAHLREADLRGANLQGANLEGAFKLASKTHAKSLIANEEIDQQAQSLEGATMPNGQKYEEWLKDKEGSGEDRENSAPS